MLQIIQGDCLTVLRTLPEESVNCCVTSPPYWGLRDYGVAEQIGLERTPDEYVEKMVEVFAEVRRVLRGDGTCWVNLGDSYNAYNGNAGPGSGFSRGAACDTQRPKLKSGHGLRTKALKPKDLVGIPWAVAFALRDDGWYLRSDIIWHKPNPMPESVTDRPTKAHEYIFLLTKSERYAYDADAIREPNETDGEFITEENKRGGWRPSGGDDRELVGGKIENGRKARADGKFPRLLNPNGRNKRTVWTVPTSPYSDAHFATFPPDLIKPCILAGCPIQCCAKCGAPWERITESESFGKDDYNGKHSHADKSSCGRNMLASVKAARAAGQHHDNPFPAKKTIGWQPTCECGCADTAPGTVLDPFGGSGTTGQVALELGRKAILIELNPAYVELIQQRTNVTPGLPLA